MWFLLLIMFCRFNFAIEPGHQDLPAGENIEDLNVQNAKEEPENKEPVEPWMTNAVLDVAYYLRRFKFSGYDIRFENRSDRMIYLGFPEPPLRNIHWEVRKYCEDSFLQCLKYLSDAINNAVLTRKHDSITAVLDGLSIDIDEANKQCLELLEQDNELFPVSVRGCLTNNGRQNKETHSEVERFQWLVSASYYMCWHTYKQHPALKLFTQPCDNFAKCLDNGNANNEDVRARNNTVPFACAHYSFCPDPCCYEKLVVSDCSRKRLCKSCEFDLNANTDLSGLMRNQWNVTCPCEKNGYKWDSQSDLCIDVDECAENHHDCKQVGQMCFNLPGTYICGCSLGFTKNKLNGECQYEPFNIFV